MSFTTIDKPLDLQIIELEILLEIDIIVFTLEFNPLETLYLNVDNFLDTTFKNYLKKYVNHINFCVSPVNSLFHKRKEIIYFLLYDFNDNFKKYKENKFSYFYDEEILKLKN
ncbi:MAG: hypothetical protein ABIP51_20090 [Bacteroidia bacterium]